jgi:hypothetical protein
VPFPTSFQSQSQGGGQQQDRYVGAGSVSLFVPEAPDRASGQWWPTELGFPNGSGAQNQVRYAYFNAAHRLAVELNGHVTVYDSLDHQIGGVSQQQGSGGTLTFTSQYGTVSVSNLPVVSVDGVPSDTQGPRVAAAPVPHSERAETAKETDISSGWPTCSRKVFSRRRSSPPKKPSYCPGCERDALSLSQCEGSMEIAASPAP